MPETSWPVPARGRRELAWVSLALLALLAATIVAVLVASQGLLVILAAGLFIAGVVIVATAWWAFTTYRPWKRRLNLTVGIVAVLCAVLAVARFSIAFAGGVVAAGVLAVAYAETARRALLPQPVFGGLDEHGSLPSRPWLLVNLASGGGKAARLGLVEHARARGIDVHVLQQGDDLRTLARSAVESGADALGVAGGDGSLRAVAGVAVESGLPFLCVPTGTRNHFAADVGLDRAKPIAALEGVDAERGRLRQVDVGLVNGQMFLNNVSLGAYADLVGEPTYRDGKFRTAHAVLPKTFRLERSPLQVSFGTPDGQRCDDAVLLFVANNSHSRASGARPRMDSGELQVSVLRARTGVEMATALTRVARRGAADTAAWGRWTTPALRVESAHEQLPAGVDGESVLLTTPLEFGILPQALRVLIPSTVPRRRGARLLEPLSWKAVRRLWALARSGRPG